MLEIIILFFLCRKIGQIVSAKGYPKIGFQIMLVVLWFGSEFAAGFIWGMLSDPNAQPGMELYLIALGAAVCSALICFGIAAALPDKNMSYPTQQRFGPAGDEMYGHNHRKPRSQTSQNPYEAPQPNDQEHRH